MALETVIKKSGSGDVRSQSGTFFDYSVEKRRGGRKNHVAHDGFRRQCRESEPSPSRTRVLGRFFLHPTCFTIDWDPLFSDFEHVSRNNGKSESSILSVGDGLRRPRVQNSNGKRFFLKMSMRNTSPLKREGHLVSIHLRRIPPSRGCGKL